MRKAGPPARTAHELEPTPAPFANRAKGCGTRKFNFQELQILKLAHPPDSAIRCAFTPLQCTLFRKSTGSNRS